MNTSSPSRLYHGDCIEMLDLIYEEYGDCVDLGFADPPYNLEKSYQGYSDDRMETDYLDWCNEWLLRFVKLLKPHGALFVLNLPKWTMHHAVTLNNHLYFQNWIVWDALSDPRGYIMPAHYGLLYYTVHPTQYTLNPIEPVEPAGRCLRAKCVKGRNPNLPRENLTDIWHDVHRIKHKRDRDKHPCQLPEKLVDRIIRLASNPNDMVLDPFLGTGTTAVVAKKLDRRFIGIERDESYIDITGSRLAKLDTRDEVLQKSLPLFDSMD